MTAALLMVVAAALVVLVPDGGSDSDLAPRGVTASQLERRLERTYRCPPDRRQPTVRCRPKTHTRFRCDVTNEGTLGGTTTELEIDADHPEVSLIC